MNNHSVPEQGGFNEKLDAIIVELQVSIGKGLTKSSDLYKAKHEAKTAIRTLVLEEIIGEDEPKRPLNGGPFTNTVDNKPIVFRNALRAEQRKKLEDTNDVE